MSPSADHHHIEVERTACPLCGCNEARTLLRDLEDVENRCEGRYEVAVCGRCEQVYLSLRPTHETLPLAYQQAYHAYEDHRQGFLTSRLYTLRNRFRFGRFEKYLPHKPSRVLEVGCGNAQFLTYLEHRWGREVQLVGNDYSVERIRLSAGSRVQLLEGDLENVSFEEKFDLILMYDVLEHIRRPADILGRLAGLLSDDGVLVVQVPNWHSPWRRLFPRHWGGLQVPRHQVFFTPATLRAVLDAAGLKTESLKNVFDPGEIAVSLCNWVTDGLRLKTLPRQSPLFIPSVFVGVPIAMGLLLLGVSGEMSAVARKRG